jgi:site-specific DNA-methyltransferase (adenine-specific)
MVKNIKLYNDDCFNVFPKIKDKSIDLFILDLPYGQTACKWDILIDLDKMWTEIKRTMKPSAVICFFCTTKFGYSIIKSNEKWFKYDLIWKKSRKVGFLSANKRQLRQHENVYVFKEEQGTYHPQKVKGDKVYKDKRNTANNKGYYRKEGDLYTPKQQDNGGFYHPTSIIEHENVYVFNNDNNDDIEIKRNLVLRKYAEKVKEYINKPMKTIDKDIGNQGIHHFYAFNSSQFGLPIEKNYKKLI